MRSLVAVLLALAPLAPFARAGDLPPARSPVGMNLALNSDWVPQTVFVDAMKQSRGWTSGTRSGVAAKVDANGWPVLAPGESASTVVFDAIDGHYPAGLYTCLHAGSGTLAFTGDAKLVAPLPGGAIVEVVPTSRGIGVTIVSSVPSDPIRDLRLILPGFEKTFRSQPFHPLFLQRLGQFEVVRFMDFQRTVNSPVRTWADRVTPTYATQTSSRGVALEHLIDLSNALGRDPWLCVPHEADDDYVRQMAALVRDRLDPWLRVHIEYSNEIWNDKFTASKYCQSQGTALGLGKTPLEARFCYQALRSMQIFDIFESTLGSRNRLVRVLAGQGANDWILKTVLGFRDAWQHADAIAINAYFGGQIGNPRTWKGPTPKSVDEVLAAAADSIGVLTKAFEKHAVLARDHGLDLFAYEGGQHLVGIGPWTHDPVLARLLQDANRDPEMADLYARLLESWNASGGDLFMAYSFVYKPSDFGSWGVLEHLDQDERTAPKYRALLDHQLGR